MKRLTKQDWLEEGFKVLQEFAQNKLRILYLCERLGVTRGSFYHHFKSIEDYIEALMEAWIQSQTLDLIKKANQANSPIDQMQKLDYQILNFNQSIEASIRSWSFYHPVVKKYMKKVDELRIRYTAQLLESSGIPADAALVRAKLEYATLTGLQQLYPEITPKELAELYETFRKNIKHT